MKDSRHPGNTNGSSANNFQRQAERYAVGQVQQGSVRGYQQLSHKEKERLTSRKATHSQSTHESDLDEATMEAEGALLARLDLDILRSEETELMHNILTNIREGEALDGRTRHPFVTSHTADATGREQDSPTSLPSSKPSKTSRISHKKLVLSIDEQLIVHSKKTLPKIVDGSLLFSRAEFQTCVTIPVQRALRTYDRFQSCQIDIKQHPRDPLAYQVTYRGPKPGQYALAKRTEMWIQYRVICRNLERLFADGENILVDVDMDPCQRLGVTIGASASFLQLSVKQEPSNTKGVWINVNIPDGGLAKALGMEVFREGCAIQSVNDDPCNSPSFLQQCLKAAKTSNQNMKVTICLFKLADFSKVDRCQHRLRRVDGKKYEPEYYSKFRWSRDPPPAKPEHPPSWLKYPVNSSTLPPTLPTEAARTKRERIQAINTILSNERSVLVEISLAASEPMGSEMTENAASRPGVWCHHMKSNGQLMQVLGYEACRLGVVLLEANGAKIYSERHLSRIRQLATATCGSIHAKLVLYDGTDLSTINTSKLVKSGKNPQRLNGEPYPLHLVKPNAQTSSKKKRGRPKKGEKSDQATNGAKAPKKKRGISPKASATAAAAATLQENAVPPKKKRGRPRKNPLPATSLREAANPTLPSPTTIVGAGPTTTSQKSKAVDIRSTAPPPAKQPGTTPIPRRNSASTTTEEPSAKKARPNPDGNSGVNGANAEKNMAQPSQQGDQYRSCQSFREKYKPMVEAEYGSTGISLTKALSSMYAQHKLEYGNGVFCDGSCKCLGNVLKLNKNVISDFVAEQEKKGNRIDEESLKPVGFIPHFTKRFLPLLKKEYPEETPNQLIQRLVAMWSIHQKHRIFGVRCKEDCECDQAWEFLFGKGDKRNAQNPPRRGSASGAQKSAPSQEAGAAANANRLPRKKKEGGSFSALMKGIMTVPQKQAAPQISQADQLEKYDVNFNSSDPLGLYFVTDTGGAVSKCKVHSVCPSGQAKRDPRIQRGTIVDSVIVDSVTTQISNQVELRVHYVFAKKHNATMRIFFVNSDVRSTAWQSASSFQRDWSRAGSWKGSLDSGWAGGAGIQSVLEKHALAAQSSSESRSTHVASQPTSASTAPKKPADGWKLAPSNIMPSHRTLLPPKSLLRRKGQGDRKSVKFATSFSSLEYDTQSRASERMVRASTVEAEDGGHEARLSSLSPKVQITNAIENQTCQELIAVLDNGAASDPYVAEHGLQEIYDSLKHTLEKSPNSASREKHKDLQAKRAVLKIFLGSAYWISMAMSLNSWSKLEIQVRHIEIKVRAGSYGFRGASKLYGAVFSTYRGVTEKLGELPVRQLSEYVLYDDEDSPMSIFLPLNNIHFDAEVRLLEIGLEAGTDDASVPRTKLGSVVVPLNEVDVKCGKSEEGVQHKFRSEQNQHVERVEVEVFARKQNVDRQFIFHKRQEGEKKLWEQTEAIEKFNTDHQTESLKMSGNVKGHGRISLLHAAIYLQMEDLVKRLVSLGVNPRERSDKGTAIGLAVRTKDNVLEKLEKEKSQASGGSWDEDDDNAHRRGRHKRSDGDYIIRKQTELYDKYSRIVGLLRSVNTRTTSSSTTLANQVLRSPPARNTNVQGNGEQHSTAQSASSNDQAIFRNILSVVPTPEGYKAGTAARKSRICSEMMKLYPKRFATKGLRTSFLDNLITAGVVETTLIDGQSGLRLTESPATEPGAGKQVGYAVTQASANFSAPGKLETLPDDETLLRNILKSLPTPPGYEPGTAATKANVGSKLGEKYPGHFGKIPSALRGFFERVLSNGTARQTTGSPVLLVLGHIVPSDETLLKEVLASAPSAAGYKHGRAVRKADVGKWLKSHYPGHFDSDSKVKAFCEGLLPKGLAVEMTSSDGDLVLRSFL